MARVVSLPHSEEATAWKWMRYSGLLLIPLAWGHVLIQDVLVGADRINLNYVSLRWAYLGWRFYDFFLLIFALAHGLNGLRQIIMDFTSRKDTLRLVNGTLLAVWLLLAGAGIAALVGGVGQP